MKTKPFLLATAGSTVDGRTIDDKMIDQMASSYDPKTYGARLNIEHIRGISGDKPFRAYGDVLELSTGEVEVNFNGKTEKRKGLYGVFDVTEDAKALNQSSQKVYPSIEILPDFGGKGFAYLAGCALTDSPAAIGTDRLVFNRALPGTITLSAEASGVDGATIELAEEVAAADAAAGIVAGFFTKLGDKLGLNGLGAGGQQQSEQPASPAAPAAAPAFDPAQFAKDLGDTLGQAFAKQAEGFDAALGKVTTDLAELKSTIEKTPAPGFTQRPLATGGEGQAKTDC